jgi:hypothetical protein
MPHEPGWTVSALLGWATFAFLLAAGCGNPAGSRNEGVGGAGGDDEGAAGTGGMGTGGAGGRGGAGGVSAGPRDAGIGAATEDAGSPRDARVAESDAAGPNPDGAAPSGGDASAAPTDPGEAPAGWTLRWSAKAATTGKGAFEGEETAECTHAGAQHFGISEGRYRIDMHYPADTDCKAGDRQRNEVKGMANPQGGYISMKEGETWLITYSMFIPDTLDATTGFTHIHQIFAAVGTMATVGPVVTMSLHQHDGVPSIEMRIDGNSGPHFSPVPLEPIQNRWVRVEFEVKWASAGTFRWTIRDGERVHVNAMRAWNGWRGGERMRPKWGIYRKRDSAGLQNTYLLLDDFRVYQR